MGGPHPFIPGAEREDAPLGQLGPVDVDLPELGPAAPLMFDGALITELDNGEVEVDLDGDGPIAGDETSEDANDHYANLAQFLTDGELSTIAQDVDEMVRADLHSRAPWYQRLAKGLELIGVIDETGAQPAFKGASTAHHPLIAEAIVQYQARALTELYPATGPAKATVLGARTRQKMEQGERVADYINYQLTFDDRTYFAECDRKLFLQGSDGSVFRKVYRDPLLNKNISRIVKAEHFVVPYSATSLEDAPRYTHLLYYTQNEMKRMQKSGFYRDAALAIPSARSEEAENEALTQARDKQEGRSDPDTRDEDREHCVYEMMVEYDLPRFQDKDESEKPTGVALPYVISVERDSLKVLSIRRGWREADVEFKRRRIQFVHYPFIRGDGFYGYGLIHIAGGLGKAATGVLRCILDNAAFAALQGGFKAKDGIKTAGSLTMEPGVYKEVEGTYEELEKTFFNPPFKDVPVALFNVLGLLTDMGQRMVSTTDATVGDAKNTGPVGTTVALIEQGQKVATGIHKRSHEALGQELRLLAELNGEHLPAEGYPYDVPGASRQIYREDFGPAIDVVPVSDPNIFSHTQRIALAQAVLELSDRYPDLYDRREANRMMLDAMKVPDVDTVLPPAAAVKRCDPVTENAKAMTGEPIKVFADQAHDAHIAVHMGQLQLLVAQGSMSLQTAKQILMPHIQAHEAHSMRLKMMQQLGMSLPPLDETTDEEGNELPALPPELENSIAMRAAQTMQALVQQLNDAQTQMKGAAQPPAEDPARADAEFAAEQQRKDVATDKDEQRKDLKLHAEIDRHDAKSGIDPIAVKRADEFLRAHGMDKSLSARRVAVIANEFDTDIPKAVLMLMHFAQAGQGQGPAPFAMPILGGQRQ